MPPGHAPNINLSGRFQTRGHLAPFDSRTQASPKKVRFLSMKCVSYESEPEGPTNANPIGKPGCFTLRVS